jgi:hypothetical protein
MVLLVPDVGDDDDDWNLDVPLFLLLEGDE